MRRTEDAMVRDRFDRFLDYHKNSCVYLQSGCNSKDESYYTSRIGTLTVLKLVQHGELLQMIALKSSYLAHVDGVCPGSLH